MHTTLGIFTTDTTTVIGLKKMKTPEGPLPKCPFYSSKQLNPEQRTTSGYFYPEQSSQAYNLYFTKFIFD